MVLLVLFVLAAAALGIGLFAVIFFVQGKYLSANVTRALAAEPVVLRTGRVWLDASLDGYRRGAVVSSRKSKGVAGEVVLTETSLFAFVPFEIRVGEGELAGVTVTHDRESVKVATKTPVDAEGSVVVKWPTDKPKAWVDALVARGAVVDGQRRG